MLDLVNYAPDVPASLVKDGGRVASPTGAAGEGPGRTMVMAAPTRENLERLARLVADGTLRVHVQATYELAQAPDALSALGSAHSQGKLAIHINDTTRHQLSHHIAVSDKANATSGNGRFAGKVAFGAGSGSGRARAHGGVVAS